MHAQEEVLCPNTDTYVVNSEPPYKIFKQKCPMFYFYFILFFITLHIQKSSMARWNSNHPGIINLEILKPAAKPIFFKK